MSTGKRPPGRNKPHIYFINGYWICFCFVTKYSVAVASGSGPTIHKAYNMYYNQYERISRDYIPY